MPKILPQDQSTADVQANAQGLKRRNRISLARKEKGDDRKVQIAPQEGHTKNGALVTVPIETWDDMIRLARLGQKSLQNEAEGVSRDAPTNDVFQGRRPEVNRIDENGDAQKHRISATIAALRRRH